MTDLRALLAAATPRPWTWLPDDAPLGRRFGGEGALEESGYVRKDEDAALIVALVNCADELLAVTEAARAFILDGDIAGVAHVGDLRAALAALDAKTGAA